jgi:hypothetical protein
MIRESEVIIGAEKKDFTTVNGDVSMLRSRDATGSPQQAPLFQPQQFISKATGHEYLAISDPG